MDSNAQNIINLYKDLSDKSDANGEPIASIIQIEQTTLTTYLQERTFDGKTGKEGSPLLHTIDLKAIAAGKDELLFEIDVIQEITDTVAKVSPSTPVKLAPKVG